MEPFTTKTLDDQIGDLNNIAVRIMRQANHLRTADRSAILETLDATLTGLRSQALHAHGKPFRTVQDLAADILAKKGSSV